ncbi:MAG: GTP-binding protein, partial [Pseudomonadota bacterium]|nr:GTP-binding protein [Pseudomonadota bacterium]
MLTQPKTLLPFTVLGGFLGAGKTTLLNRLLTETQDTRFAVLVNDFGELNIDERLVTRHDGETIALTNGCMCCSMVNGFVSALTTVMDRSEAFDHVVVEASGVANPRRIMDIATLDPGLMPNGSIVLVDCPQFLSQLEDPLINDAVITQLVEADIIVMNKLALTDAATITRVHRRIDQLNPGCPTVINDGENLQPA